MRGSSNKQRRQQRNTVEELIRLRNLAAALGLTPGHRATNMPPQDALATLGRLLPLAGGGGGGGVGGGGGGAVSGAKRTSEVIDLVSSDEDDNTAAVTTATRPSSTLSTTAGTSANSGGRVVASSSSNSNLAAARGNASAGIVRTSNAHDASMVVDLVDSDDDDDDNDDEDERIHNFLVNDDGDSIFDTYSDSDRSAEDFINNYLGTGGGGPRDLTARRSAPIASTSVARPPVAPAIRSDLPVIHTVTINSQASSTSAASSAAKKAKVIDSGPISRSVKLPVKMISVSVKTEFPPKKFGEADIEGELTEISMTVEVTPAKDSHNSMSLGNLNSNSNSNSKSNKNSNSSSSSSSSSISGSKKPSLDDDDSDIEVVGDNMMSISDMPHSRESCTTYRFNINPTKNLLYCQNCYCYVCEIKASECKDWKAHCFANCKEAKWKNMRRFNKMPLMKLITGDVIAEIQAVVKDARDPAISSHYDRERSNDIITNAEYPLIRSTLGILDVRPFSQLLIQNEHKLIEQYRARVIRGLYIIYQHGLTTDSGPSYSASSNVSVGKNLLQRLLMHVLHMPEIIDCVLNLPSFEYYNKYGTKVVLDVKEVISSLKFNVESLSKYFSGKRPDPPYSRAYDDLMTDEAISFLKIGVCYWISRKSGIKLFEFLLSYSSFQSAIICLMNLISNTTQISLPNWNDHKEFSALLVCIGKMSLPMYKWWLNNERHQAIITYMKLFNFSSCIDKEISVNIKKLPNYQVLLLCSACQSAILRYTESFHSTAHIIPSEFLTLSRAFLTESFDRFFTVSPNIASSDGGGSSGLQLQNVSLERYSLEIMSWLQPMLDDLKNKYPYPETALDPDSIAATTTLSDQEMARVYIFIVLRYPNLVRILQSNVVNMLDSVFPPELEHQALVDTFAQRGLAGVDQLNLAGKYAGMFQFLPELNSRSYLVFTAIFLNLSRNGRVSLYLWLYALYHPEIEGTFEVLPDRFILDMINYCRLNGSRDCSPRNMFTVVNYDSFKESEIRQIYKSLIAYHAYHQQDGKNPFTSLSYFNQLMLLSLFLFGVGNPRASYGISAKNILFLIDNLSMPLSRNFVVVDPITSSLMFSYAKLDACYHPYSLAEGSESTCFSEDLQYGSEIQKDFLYHHCMHLLIASDRYKTDQISFIYPSIRNLATFWSELGSLDFRLKRDATITTAIPAFIWVWVKKCSKDPAFKASVDGVDALCILFSLTSKLATESLSIKEATDAIMYVLDSISGDYRSKVSLKNYPQSFLLTLHPKETERIMFATLDPLMIQNYISSIMSDTSYTNATNKYMALLLLINNLKKTAKSMSMKLDSMIRIGEGPNSLISSHEFSISILMNNYDLLTEKISLSNRFEDFKYKALFDESCFITSVHDQYSLKYFFADYSKNSNPSRLKFDSIIHDFMQLHVSYINSFLPSSLINSVANLGEAIEASQSEDVEASYLLLMKELNNMTGLGDLLLISYLINFSIQISTATLSFMKSVIWNGPFTYDYFSACAGIKELFAPIITLFKQVIDQYFDVISRLKYDLTSLTLSSERIILTAVIDSFDLSKYPIGFIAHSIMSERELAPGQEATQPIHVFLSEVQYLVFYLESIMLEIDFLAQPTPSKFTHYIGLVKDLNKNVVRVNGVREESLLCMSPLELGSDITRTFDCTYQANELSMLLWNISLMKINNLQFESDITKKGTCAWRRDSVLLPIIMSHFPIGAVQRLLQIYADNRISYDIYSYGGMYEDSDVCRPNSVGGHAYFMLKISSMIAHDSANGSMTGGVGGVEVERAGGGAASSAGVGRIDTSIYLAEYAREFEQVYGNTPESLVIRHNCNVDRVNLIKSMLTSSLLVTNPSRLVEIMKHAITFICDYIDPEYVYFLRPNIEIVLSLFFQLTCFDDLANGDAHGSSGSSQWSNKYDSHVISCNYSYDDCVISGALNFSSCDISNSSIGMDHDFDVNKRATHKYFYVDGSFVLSSIANNRGFPSETYDNNYGSTAESRSSDAMDMSGSQSRHKNSHKYIAGSDNYKYQDVTRTIEVLKFLARPSSESFFSLRMQDWLYSDMGCLYEKLHMFCLTQPSDYGLMLDVLIYYQDFRPLYDILARFSQSKRVLKNIISSLNQKLKPKGGLLFPTFTQSVPFDFLFGAKGLLTNLGSWILFHANTLKCKDGNAVSSLNSDINLIESFESAIANALDIADWVNLQNAAACFLNFVLNVSHHQLVEYMAGYIKTAKDSSLSSASSSAHLSPVAAAAESAPPIKLHINAIFDKILTIKCISSLKFLQLMNFVESLPTNVADSAALADRVMSFLCSDVLVVGESSLSTHWSGKYFDTRTIVGMSRVFSSILASKADTLKQFSPSIVSRLFSMFKDEVIDNSPPPIEIMRNGRSLPIVSNFNMKVKYSSTFEAFKDMVTQFVKGNDVLSRCFSSIVNIWVLLSSEFDNVAPMDLIDSKQLKDYIEHGFKMINEVQQMSSATTRMEVGLSPSSSSSSGSNNTIDYIAVFDDYARLLCRFFIKYFLQSLSNQTRRILDTCASAFDIIMYLTGLLPAPPPSGTDKFGKRTRAATAYLSELQSFIVEAVKFDAAQTTTNTSNIFDHIVNVYLKKTAPINATSSPDLVIDLKKTLFASLETMALGLFPLSDFNMLSYYNVRYDSNFRSSILTLYRKVENQEAVLALFKVKFNKIMESCESQRLDARSKESITECIKAFKHYYIMMNLENEWKALIVATCRASKKKTLKDILIQY